jgi:putative ABC transport system permease protein
LLILGLILVPVFRSNQVYVVFPYLLAMMLFATREASLKPKLRYVGMTFNMFASILTSTSIWLTVIMFGVLKPSPWWDAQVVIPVAGMMLGSCVNAQSLGMDRFLSFIRGESGNGSALLQTYMNCGATKWYEVACLRDNQS